MNKIRVIKEIKYRNCPIYIRALDNRFEFLVIFNNRLYSQYMVVVPNWWRRIFGERFTEEQIERIVKLLLVMAHKTIDSLRDKKKKK